MNEITRALASTVSGGAPTDAEYVVMSANATLTDERVLAVTAPITKTDGGAGGNVTIAHDVSGVTNGTYGTSLKVASFTVNLLGHLTAASEIDIATMVGDSGAGGTKGLVPAPASGDAAAGKFLKADGTWTAPSSGGAPTGAQYVTLALDGTLTAERVLTAGTGITLTDGGANGNATIAAPGLADSFVTIANSAYLANERALAATSPIVLTDGGAGSSATLTHAMSGVSAATYGSSLLVPVLAVNATGHLTSVTDTAIATLVGDSGSGGTKGLAPAPAAGDAAADKFLNADGTWAPSYGVVSYAQAIQFTRYMIASPSVATFTTVGVRSPSLSNAAAATVASTSRFTLLPRLVHGTTSTAANQTALVNGQTAFVCRGDATGRGGFRFTLVFGIESNSGAADFRWFLGLRAAMSAPALSSFVPSNCVDCLLFGADPNDTTVQIMHNDASGTCTRVDSGFTFPTGSSFIGTFECAGNSADVTYTLVKDGGGSTFSGTISTNLPTNTTLLGAIGWINNSNSGASTNAGQMFTSYWGWDMPLYVPTA